jgi:hypothetical protein
MAAASEAAPRAGRFGSACRVGEPGERAVTEPRRSVPKKVQEAFRLMMNDPSIDLHKAALK